MKGKAIRAKLAKKEKKPETPSESSSSDDEPVPKAEKKTKSTKTKLKKECMGVFNANKETMMMFDLFSGTKKDYYLTVSTKSIG